SALGTAGQTAVRGESARRAARRLQRDQRHLTAAGDPRRVGRTVAVAPRPRTSRPGAAGRLARHAALAGHTAANRPGGALAGVPLPSAVPGRRADLGRSAAARARGRGAGADRIGLSLLARGRAVDSTDRELSALTIRLVTFVIAAS